MFKIVIVNVLDSGFTYRGLVGNSPNSVGVVYGLGMAIYGRLML